MPLKYIMIVCKEMAIEHFNKEENKIGENRNKNNKKHKRSNVFNIITHYGIFFMHFSVWDLHVYVYEKKNEKKKMSSYKEICRLFYVHWKHRFIVHFEMGTEIEL